MKGPYITLREEHLRFPTFEGFEHHWPWSSFLGLPQRQDIGKRVYLIQKPGEAVGILQVESTEQRDARWATERASGFRVTDGCTYFDSAIDVQRRKRLVEKAIKTLTPRLTEFDVIACRGYSGMSLAPVLSHLLDKGLLFVRKSGEHSHCCSIGAGTLAPRYIIIDDFISTGSTIRAIIEYVKERHTEKLLPPPEFAGIYLYDPDGGSNDGVSNGAFKQFEGPDIPMWRVPC